MDQLEQQTADRQLDRSRKVMDAIMLRLWLVKQNKRVFYLQGKLLH